MVCTALTVQDSNRVYGFEPVSPALIREQAEKVLANLWVDAIKVGMLGSAEVAYEVGLIVARNPQARVVLDPVLASNSGGSLANSDLLEALSSIFPHTTLITPNTVEARRLTGHEDLETAIWQLRTMGARHILLKGGHEPGDTICNRLYNHSRLMQESHWPRLPGEYHGSGCTLASAIAVGLAAGRSLKQAVADAEAYVCRVLSRADRPRDEGQFLPVRILPEQLP